jgi:soluble P-type ATPase
VPGNYGVFLFPGHSIEQHSAAIKTDITPHIMHIVNKLWADRVVYSVRNIDNDLLAAIRSDPGVEFVELDHAPPQLRLVGDVWM